MAMCRGSKPTCHSLSSAGVWPPTVSQFPEAVEVPAGALRTRAYPSIQLPSQGRAVSLVRLLLRSSVKSAAPTQNSCPRPPPAPVIPTPEPPQQHALATRATPECLHSCKHVPSMLLACCKLV